MDVLEMRRRLPPFGAGLGPTGVASLTAVTGAGVAPAAVAGAGVGAGAGTLGMAL